MKRILALLVVLAAGIAAAAFTVPSDAATVGGQSISQGSLNTDLSVIAANPSYQCLLAAQVAVQSNGRASLPPIEGVNNGSYNAAFVAYWLDQMINARLVQEVASRHGAHVGSAQLRTARGELVQSIQSTFTQVQGTRFQCQVPPSAVLASLPASFTDEQVQNQAYTDALLSQVPGGALSDQALQRFFNQQRSQFDTICVSGIVVADQATAQQLRTQIEGGTPFSQVAAAHSLDTTSAQKGGSLGCFSATSSSYASLRQDVGNLSPGQVTQPLAGQGGQYVLLQVDLVTPARFSDVKSAVRQAVLSRSRTRASAVLAREAGRARVAVNPSYGRWTPSSVTAGVLPPKSPPASSVLTPAANIPTFANSSTAGSAATGGTSG